MWITTLSLNFRMQCYYCPKFRLISDDVSTIINISMYMIRIYMLRKGEEGKSGNKKGGEYKYGGKYKKEGLGGDCTLWLTDQHWKNTWEKHGCFQHENIFVKNNLPILTTNILILRKFWEKIRLFSCSFVSAHDMTVKWYFPRKTRKVY